MDSNLIFQAIVESAPRRRAPRMQASYEALKARLLTLNRESTTLRDAVLAYENNPASAPWRQTLRHAFDDLNLPDDDELVNAAQLVLDAAANQELLGNKTTSSHSRAGEIVCDYCGEVQPESRIVCWVLWARIHLAG